MSKETVVRENRCDQEMNILLFGCYFLFLAMQLLITDVTKSVIVNGINKALYLVFVPGFLFLLGYRYHALLCKERTEERKNWIRKNLIGYYLCFLVLAIAAQLQGNLLGAVITDRGRLISVFCDILGLLKMPAAASVFFTIALVLSVLWFTDDKMGKLLKNHRWMLIIGIAALLCTFLQYKGECYTIVAALVGSDQSAAVPGIPYFSCFLLGSWFEEKKPGFQLRMLLISAAVSVLSLAMYLYAAPLHNLAAVTISALPLYLIYVLSEGLYEVNLRIGPAKQLCEKSSWIFGCCALLLLTAAATGRFSNAGFKRTFLIAAGIVLFLAASYFGFLLMCRIYEGMITRFRTKVKHKTAVYFLIYTLIFGLFLFLVFFDFLWRGKSFIIMGDGVSQYYPRALQYIRYIREMVKGLIGGSFQLPMYEFRNGLGAEVTFSLEPLYFLYALFGENNIELAFNLLTLLRIYLAGITSSVMILYFGKGYYAAFLGSVIYIFSGFTLYGGVMHPMFMIPMIMLPLLILSMEEILRSKRWYFCSLFVAASLLSNYYFLYMNTIAMGIYFLVRFLCQKDKTAITIKNFIGRGLVISGSYLLGVGMGCMTLFTTFGKYLGSGRKGASMIKTASMFFYRSDWLQSCFQTFLTTANSPGEWLKLGYLPIAMLAIAILFSRKGRKELKIFSVISVIFMAFPVFGFVFSGFSTIINRWCYMVSLLTGFITAECLPDMLQMNKKDKYVCSAVTALYVFLAFFGNYYKNTNAVKIAAVLLLLTFAVVLICQKSYRFLTVSEKRCILFLLTALLVFYQGYSLYEGKGLNKQYADTGYTKKTIKNTPLRAVSELQDDTFYRCVTPKLSYNTGNASMLLDYYSTSLISSTYNGSINQYYRMMGNTSFSSMQYLGFGNRLFENDLASVKYYAHYGEDPRLPLPYGYEEVLETEVKGKKVKVYENSYALPLGYTYDSAISQEELEKYDVLERQEILMQQVMLQEPGEFTSDTEPEITSEAVLIAGVEEDGICMTDHEMIAGKGDKGSKEKGNYKVTLNFESRPESETYLILHNAFMKGDMSEDAMELSIRVSDGTRLVYSFEADDYRYNTGQEDFVFNLGYHTEPITSCKIIMKREGVIQFDSLEICSQSMENVQAYTDRLKENQMEAVTLGNNYVSGRITLDKKKMLVFSLPYQNGWKAFVDGEEVELQRANYMYMAVPLDAGVHEIRLTFAIPGVKYGLIVTSVSCGLFLLLVIVNMIISKRKRKQNLTDQE